MPRNALDISCIYQGSEVAQPPVKVPGPHEIPEDVTTTTLTEGQQWLDAAATTGGTSATVRDLVERLPGRMDFYVPLPEQRRSWRGSSDVVVAAILDPDATEAVGFDTQGRGTLLFSPADAGASAFFIIHPAEHKSAQARLLTEGETIEELQASTATGVVMLAATCGPNALEGCTGGGGTGCVANPQLFGTYVCEISVVFGDGLSASTV